MIVLGSLATAPFRLRSCAPAYCFSACKAHPFLHDFRHLVSPMGMDMQFGGRVSCCSPAVDSRLCLQALLAHSKVAPAVNQISLSVRRWHQLLQTVWAVVLLLSVVMVLVMLVLVCVWYKCCQSDDVIGGDNEDAVQLCSLASNCAATMT